MSGECEKCPFCGSDMVNLVPSLMAADYVECHNCWAHGPIISSGMKDKPKNRKKAIKAWNKRYVG